MTDIQRIIEPEIFARLNNLEATITDYRSNSTTMAAASSKLALKSLERRRNEALQELTDALDEAGFVPSRWVELPRVK